MASEKDPITVTEALTLGNVGINPEFISSGHVTMDSEKYICVTQTSPQKSVVLIDMSMPTKPRRWPINTDSALMNPNGRILALKAHLPRTSQDHLQIFNIESSAKIKTHSMPEQVVFWKWITPKKLGLVTRTLVYHWSIEGDAEPAKMFAIIENLSNNQITDYRCDPSEKFLVVLGIAPGAPERPQLAKGNMQLFSVDQVRSQALEAHAVSFASFKVGENENPSTLICFASKTTHSGQITSKLDIVELDALPGRSHFARKKADIFFPPECADDFPVGMQISRKYGLIYVITKLGLLFVYDLETATSVYRNRLSADPIFLTTEALGVGGFYAVNGRGQVLLATVSEATFVPFIRDQLNNFELAVSLAKRGNLPGTEDLIVQKFQELVSQKKYKEAAELAAKSPQGLIRTPETVAKLQSIPVQVGEAPPVLQYYGTLLNRGKLTEFESVELSRLVVYNNKLHLLHSWLAEDKLECSEELGDLVKTVDSDLALKIYVTVFAERREFYKIITYSKQVGYTPDYLRLLQTILRSDPQGALNFAFTMSQMEGGCPLDYNTITDLFLRRNLIREATAFLLDVLKPNLPEHGSLQTKVLEINLLTYPNVADSILANGMFSHYDRPRIRQLCEKAGLFMRALQLDQSKPQSHDKYNEENKGQSYQTNLEEEQAECSNGSKILNFRDEWSSLEMLYSDIKDATNGLSESSIIGKGGYGSVYKGKLGSTTIAIKILDSTSKQGQKEFFQELEVLYQMRHPNLVKLVGACFEVHALVYEFLPNGSLEDCLKDSPGLLTWQMRTRIIYEICSALIYLHSRSVIHGDLKPANILLDANFKSKLSDFGLCRFLPKEMTTAVYLETVPKGTSGYIDPWFLETCILRPGSDLYSFGITILKLLTRMPAVGLGRIACDVDENSFRKMIDPTAESWPFELAKELLYWSLQCCYHNEKSLELLKDMSACLEDMLAEIETLQEGRSKVVVRRKKAAENLFKVEEKKEEPVVIVVLKVQMPSEVYASEIKRKILRLKGVWAVEPELKASQVTVKGVLDPPELVEYVQDMIGTDVAIVKVEGFGTYLKEDKLKGEESQRREGGAEGDNGGG